VPYTLLYAVSAAMELVSMITRTQPLMMRSQVKNFREGASHYNTAKAKNELGFNPRPAKDAIRDALSYLSEK
jgi:dihydroflavonol-4-reductase